MGGTIREGRGVPRDSGPPPTVGVRDQSPSRKGGYEGKLTSLTLIGMPSIPLTKGVIMARKQSEESLAGQIRALDAGESFSRTRRLTIEEADQGATTAALAKLRNVVNQAVGRIRKDGGSNFRVESTVGITDDKQALLCTVAVTRMDGEDDEEQDI